MEYGTEKQDETARRDPSACDKVVEGGPRKREHLTHEPAFEYVDALRRLAQALGCWPEHVIFLAADRLSRYAMADSERKFTVSLEDFRRLEKQFSDIRQQRDAEFTRNETLRERVKFLEVTESTKLGELQEGNALLCKDRAALREKVGALTTHVAHLAMKTTSGDLYVLSTENRQLRHEIAEKDKMLDAQIRFAKDISIELVRYKRACSEAKVVLGLA